MYAFTYHTISVYLFFLKRAKSGTCWGPARLEMTWQMPRQHPRHPHRHASSSYSSSFLYPLMLNQRKKPYSRPIVFVPYPSRQQRKLKSRCLQSLSIQNSTSQTLTCGAFFSSAMTDHILKTRVLSPYPLPNPTLVADLSIVIYRDADTGRAYSYAQVKSTAIELGKGLKSVWEWRKGDVLALFTPNCIDTPAITWGVHWAGGVVSPANPGYTAEELAFQLKDSGAKALATQKPFLKVAVEAATKAGIPEDRIILMGDEKDESMRFKHFSSIRNIAGTNRYRRTKVHPKNDLAFLVYSSGTTGHPKGVMLCHENIISNLLMLKAGEGTNLSWDGGPTGNGDNILAFLPFFHIYGRCPGQIP